MSEPIICPKCGSSTQVFRDRSGRFGCWRVTCSLPLPDAAHSDIAHPRAGGKETQK